MQISRYLLLRGSAAPGGYNEPTASGVKCPPPVKCHHYVNINMESCPERPQSVSGRVEDWRGESSETLPPHGTVARYIDNTLSRTRYGGYGPAQ